MKKILPYLIDDTDLESTKSWCAKQCTNITSRYLSLTLLCRPLILLLTLQTYRHNIVYTHTYLGVNVNYYTCFARVLEVRSATDIGKPQKSFKNFSISKWSILSLLTVENEKRYHWSHLISGQWIAYFSFISFKVILATLSIKSFWICFDSPVNTVAFWRWLDKTLDQVLTIFDLLIIFYCLLLKMLI